MRSGPSLLWTLLAVPFWITACKAPPQPELRIGLIGVFQGQDSTSSGMPARQAARMAVDELNATGGALIGGVSHRLVLRERAIPDRPAAAAAAVRELITRDSVDVVVGPQSNALAVAAGAVADSARTPLVAPMAASATVTANRTFVTRLTYLDAEQGDVLAQFAHDSLSARRVAILFEATSTYGAGIADHFARTFTALGGLLVGVEAYARDDDQDRSGLIGRIAGAAPDAVLLPDLTVRDSSLVRLLRDAGFRGRFLGSDAWDAITLRREPRLNGSIIVGNWDGRGDRDGLRVFREHWSALYLGERPRVTGAATYDAIRLIVRAAEKARARTGMGLVRALQNGAPYDGAFARYRFDGTATPIRGAILLEMTGDVPRLRATLSPLRQAGPRTQRPSAVSAR